jgi:hypothetical protein
MRINEENQFDWIDRYLENELNEVERRFLEAEKQRNPAFAEALARQVEAQATLEKILAENRYRQRADDLLKENTDFLNLIHQDQAKVVAIRPNNTRYWQMAATVFLGLVVGAYFLFFNNPFEREKEIVKNPQDTVKQKITKKPNNEVKDSTQIIKPKSPQITENKPITKEKTDRNLQIEEWILKKSMGFSGTNDIEKTSRPMLILAQSQIEKPLENQILYRLNDTLKIFGMQNPQSMRLLYQEKLGKYYLVLAKDTFPLNYRSKKWQVLRKD